jgi:hypothetical protein
MRIIRVHSRAITIHNEAGWLIKDRSVFLAVLSVGKFRMEVLASLESGEDLLSSSQLAPSSSVPLCKGLVL